MAEKITEQEVVLRTKKHEFYCDVCGSLISSYMDTQTLEDKDSIIRPDNLVCTINIASNWFSYNKLLCTECRVKKIQELVDSVSPVLLDLGFVADR